LYDGRTASGSGTCPVHPESVFEQAKLRPSRARIGARSAPGQPASAAAAHRRDALDVALPVGARSPREPPKLRGALLGRAAQRSACELRRPAGTGPHGSRAVPPGASRSQRDAFKRAFAVAPRARPAPPHALTPRPATRAGSTRLPAAASRLSAPARTGAQDADEGTGRRGGVHAAVDVRLQRPHLAEQVHLVQP
jgi:hypothetical protein